MLQPSLRQRLSQWVAQRLWRKDVVPDRPPSATRRFRRPARRIRSREDVSFPLSSPTRGGSSSSTAALVDVARLGLWSIATLPVSLWIALFSYSYVNRVRLCEEALDQGATTQHWQGVATTTREETKQQDNNEKQEQPMPASKSSSFFREAQLAEVQALLSQPPRQIVVVAGGNESGKTRLVAELIRRLASQSSSSANSLQAQQPVVHIPMAPTVDSLSTLTHALVRSFGLQWLAMRHALVDMLPFAGSEILVMKERYSARDLATALYVVTQALEAASASPSPRGRLQQRPVIIMDGLGESSGQWITQTTEGQKCWQRLLEWCIWVTKERQLAHVVLTGNEQLVTSLTDQHKMTRGHVKVVGLGDLDVHSSLAHRVILQVWPNATHDERQQLLDTFGGFIHDLQTTSRQIHNQLTRSKHAQTSPSAASRSTLSRAQIVDQVIAARLRQQVERVTAAFAMGRVDQDDDEGTSDDGSNEDEELDPFLDPLKVAYSEAHATHRDASGDPGSAATTVETKASWSQLQLWLTLERLVHSESLSVPFGELRDDVFDGDKTPLLDLMQEDVLGFDIDSNTDGVWSWNVKPATPAIGHAFQHLTHDVQLKSRFAEIRQATERQSQIQDIERQRQVLRRERRRIEARKASLQSTIALGKELGRSWATRRQLSSMYNSIVREEAENERQGQTLRRALAMLRQAATIAESDMHKGEHNNVSKASRSPSIKRLLMWSLLEQSATKDVEVHKEMMREVWGRLHLEEGGITASDLVMLIKNSTGTTIDLETAQAFIRKWDLNQDKRLDLEEVLQLFSSEPQLAGACSGGNMKKK